jgi:o-succinylbenzoate synthase
MLLNATYFKKTFKFKFDAGTSRGILREKDSYFILISDNQKKKVFGIGEAAPLKGLSIDDIPNFEEQLNHIIYNFNLLDIEVFDWNINIIVGQLISNKFPSIVFGFETALWDYLNGGQRIIFNNEFAKRQRKVEINGLIWMGSEKFMEEQISKKINEGYKTIKMKVGAIDFDSEVKLLESIRNKFDKDSITLRVDANGAFDTNQAREALKTYRRLDIHSIEQPIEAGQPDEMAKLCRENIIPIALDEELISVSDYVEKRNLLKQVMPQYIIIKPTLIGGLHASKEWIDAANQFDVEWWTTSALESNIGLNAICQFAAEYPTNLPQGLGTGQLYVENIDSPLEIEDGYISLSGPDDWNISELTNSVEFR